jgi:hypothetical protein
MQEKGSYQTILLSSHTPPTCGTNPPFHTVFLTPLNNALQGLLEYIGLSCHGRVQNALLDIANVIHNLASWPTHVSKLVQTNNPRLYRLLQSQWIWRRWHVVCGPKEVRPDCLAHSVAHRDHRCLGFQQKPNGRHHQLRLGNGRHGTAQSGPQKPPWQCHGSRAPCDWMQQLPAVSWMTHMATHSASPIAYRLLRGLAMRQ